MVEGIGVGANVGDADGASDGVVVGPSDGALVGKCVGLRVGCGVGSCVGTRVGVDEGTTVGLGVDSFSCGLELLYQEVLVFRNAFIHLGGDIFKLPPATHTKSTH